MGSGTLDNSPPRTAQAEVTFSLFLCKMIATRLRGNTTRAGRVTLARGTTSLHINALARLTGTTLGVASVTQFLDLAFQAEICIQELKVTRQNLL